MRISSLNSKGREFIQNKNINQFGVANQPSTNEGSELSGKLVVKDRATLSTDGLSRQEKKVANLMSNTISRVGEILDEMKKLSIQAENKDLSDDDRIDMQVKMTRLQANLHRETYSMGLSLSGTNYGNGQESEKRLGGSRAFSTLSIYDGLKVNDKGQNCVSYTVLHDESQDISSIDIYREYSDLNIGEIQYELVDRDRIGRSPIAAGRIETQVTLIEASGAVANNESIADKFISELLDAKESGVPLEELLQSENFAKNGSTDLLSSTSAMRFTNRIPNEINKFDNFLKEYLLVDFKNQQIPPLP